MEQLAITDAPARDLFFSSCSLALFANFSLIRSFYTQLTVYRYTYTCPIHLGVCDFWPGIERIRRVYIYYMRRSDVVWLERSRLVGLLRAENSGVIMRMIDAARYQARYMYIAAVFLFFGSENWFFLLLLCVFITATRSCISKRLSRQDE